MTPNQSKRVSIDPDRLNYLIKTGHGRKISLDIPGKKSKRTKWTLKELAEKTGLHYQRISKICRGKAGDSQNYSTAAQLAAALDVDVDYLTGEIDYETKEKGYWALNPELVPMRAPHKIRGAIDFMERYYGIRVVLDNPRKPRSYSVYDAENNLIEENKDIKKLLPLVRMIHNLLVTGSDIVSLYFDGAWIEKV